MKLKTTETELIITTNIYQSRDGAIRINFGGSSIVLEKERAGEVAFDIPEFDVESFNKFYS